MQVHSSLQLKWFLWIAASMIQSTRAQVTNETSTTLSSANPAAAGSSCHTNSLRIPSEALKYRRSPTLVIAHRGASYHLPEHTLPGYRLALELGADFIEPDLVPTRDGVLIALHTLDLNVTTNVVEVFGDTIEPWYSETAGRAAYWTFNFTWAQIQTLRVRQRLPAARTTTFDDTFAIPSLDQILETVHHWNTVDLPARVERHQSSSDDVPPGHPSPLQKYKSGLYVEFKETEWLLQEAGIDSVDLLFQSISSSLSEDSSRSNNNNYWNDLLQCFETVRYDEYLVPGLVLQSFNASDLQRFHNLWTTTIAAAEPPYILLVNEKNCWNDSFWVNIGEEWRSFLSGIGCDKACLLGRAATTTSTAEDESSLQNKRESAAFVEKAEQFGLVLHPWTERPELEYVSEAFADNYEELQYLMCNVQGVHGVFTESVDVALRVACTEGDKDDTKKNSAASKIDDENVCYNGSSAKSFFLSISFFCIGILGTLVGLRFCSSKQKREEKMFGRSTRIPTMEDEDVDTAGSDLELT